jgi:hypothetical protein
MTVLQIRISWQIFKFQIGTTTGPAHPRFAKRASARVTNHQDFFQTVLILSFLYGIKVTLIPDSEKSRNSTICRIFNIFYYFFL